MGIKDTDLAGELAPMLALGELVMVRHGVMDAEHLDLSLGGWRGRITAIDPAEATVVVAWDADTTRRLPEGYVRRCALQGVDWASMVLEIGEVRECAAADIAEGTREAFRQTATNRNPAEALAAEAHIRTALLGLDRADLAACLRAWTVYIHNRIPFPFEGEVLDDPLAAGAIPAGTPVTVTRLSGIDGANGVLAEVQSGRRKYSMPIASLRPTPRPSGLLPLEAYSTWLGERN